MRSGRKEQGPSSMAQGVPAQGPLLRDIRQRKNGGSAWESNPPATLFTQPTGFEDRAAHQHRSTPQPAWVVKDRRWGRKRPGLSLAVRGAFGAAHGAKVGCFAHAYVGRKGGSCANSERFNGGGIDSEFRVVCPTPCTGSAPACRARGSREIPNNRASGNPGRPFSSYSLPLACEPTLVRLQARSMLGGLIVCGVRALKGAPSLDASP